MVVRSASEAIEELQKYLFLIELKYVILKFHRLKNFYMIGERASVFLYLCSKITSMTFEEAVSLVDRIKDQVVGAPVKGRLIESLFIGPTN